MNQHHNYTKILTVLCFLAIASTAVAIDRVTFTQDGKETTLEGRTLVKDTAGGRLLQTADGMIHVISADKDPTCTSDDQPFKPMTADELAASLLKELPPGFDSFKTKHYVIVFSTSRPYAKWCGSLFERLYMAFQNFWKRKKLDIKEPEFPLVAIVFGSRADYSKYAAKELGLPVEQVGNVIGFYNIKTNRMVMYDVTGMSGAMSSRGKSAAQINQLLSQPGAAAATSTIVHEATHQIAHNCGVHTRMANNPLWFVEGVALYFESPDMSSAQGWKTIGQLNENRMRDFVKYAYNRPANSLETLLKDDKRLRDLSIANNGYAEAWALTYFLIRQRPKEYTKYVRLLAEKKPCQDETPEERIKTFTEIFGDPAKLDQEFMRYMGSREF